MTRFFEIFVAFWRQYYDRRPMKWDLVGLGNALLDIQAEVPETFLGEIGAAKASMSLVNYRTQEETIRKVHDAFGSRLKYTGGGSAANTLAGFVNWGGKGYFVGKVGKDENGRRYRSDLETAGVHTSLAEGQSDFTGTCLALITPDAERTMLTHLGVAVELSPNDIPEDALKQTKCIYIEGYLWDSETARASSRKAIEIAKAQRALVSMTMSDRFCVQRHKDDFIDLAKNHCDLLFCNETEAMEVTGTTSVEEAFKILKSWTPIVCVTAGPHGALLSERRGAQTQSIETWDVNLVDKLGAGDLFAAGFLFGHLSGRSLKESGYLGCYSATKIIQQMGARLSDNLKPQIPLALSGPLPNQSTLAIAL